MAFVLPPSKRREILLAAAKYLSENSEAINIKKPIDFCMGGQPLTSIELTIKGVVYDLRLVPLYSEPTLNDTPDGEDE